MIIFEFKIDEDELAEDLEFDVSSQDSCLFLISIFYMPVRLNINGIEFFRFGSTKPNGFWTYVPLVAMASSLLMVVKSLTEIEIKDYSMPGGGTFLFQFLQDDNLSVKFSGGEHEVVPYYEFLNACEQFTANVRKFLNERVPQLHQHKFWGLWLRGEFD